MTRADSTGDEPVPDKERSLEAQLEEAQRMLVSIEEIAHLGRWELDIRTGKITGSERLFAIYGLPPGSELSREDFLQVVAPEDRATVLGTIEEVIETRQPREAKFRSWRPDGSLHWIHVRARVELDEGGRPLRMVGTSQDITEREAILEELQQSERRFREMAENIREVFWLYDWKESRVIYASPAYEAVWGRTVESLHADYSEWAGSIHPEDREAAARSFEEITLAGSGAPREYRILRPDGSVRWISDRGFVIRDEAGEIVRVTGIAEDITLRREAEEERQSLQAKILHGQKLESLGVLAGGIAHDFNNLLMAIVGNADLALAILPPGAPGREQVDQIARTAESAAELTEQLLAYSGRGQVQVGRLQLNPLIEEMRGLFQTAISKKTRLELDLREPAPTIEADASQIRQIVLNLVLNASESLEGEVGSVLLSTGTVELDAELLRSCYLADALQPGKHAFVQVSDTGCGMSPETLERLFDPFYTTKFTGRGLGLAAVLGIIRGHRGTIRVQSDGAEGSTVTVYLPLLENGATVVRRAGTTPVQRAVGGTILIIEDELHVRRVTSTLLEDAGFETLQAERGREGIELYRQRGEEISLVLLDLTMPEMDGEEVHRELARLDPEVKILLCSGFSEEEVNRRFEGLTLVGFLHKPFRAATLIARVNEALATS